MGCPHVTFQEGEPTHGPDCTVQLHAFDIEALVDAETLVRSSGVGLHALIHTFLFGGKNNNTPHHTIQVKYGRFKLQKTTPNARECPACSHSQIGDPRVPAMTCTACSARFCFFHGNAHVNTTCKRWEARQRRDNKKSEAAISKFAKPCPRCHVAVIKSAGCNHMVCSKSGVWFIYCC
jgi:hypothetical protein